MGLALAKKFFGDVERRQKGDLVGFYPARCILDVLESLVNKLDQRAHMGVFVVGHHGQSMPEDFELQAPFSGLGVVIRTTTIA